MSDDDAPDAPAARSTVGMAKAAERLGVSVATARRMCDDGRIESVRRAGTWRRVYVDSIERWNREHSGDEQGPETQ